MKKICSVVLCLCLLLSVVLPVMAAQDANLIQNVWFDESKMTLICADSVDGDGSYQVKVDGQEVPLEKSIVRTEEVPTTIFCLVDTSGSISEFKLRLVRETLTELSKSMGENDNMVIATLSNSLNVGPVLRTPEERANAIANLIQTAEDTNLYSGIVQSLEKLTSDLSYNSHSCLVVLSDGLDKQDNGLTEQEVMNAIELARRPLYTVALIESATEREGGKVLGSFARCSYGGLHQTTIGEGANAPIRWYMTGDEFGNGIWGSMQTMAVLYADLTDVAVDVRKNEVRLDVICQSGSDAYSDMMMIDATALNTIPDATEPSEEETTEETTVPVPEPTEEPKSILSNPIVWVCVGVLLLLIAILVLVLMKKKSRKQVDQLENTQMELEQLDVTREVEDERANKFFQQEEAKTEVVKQKYKVYMTDIPYGTQKLTFTVNAVEVVTFGRDPKKATCLLNKTDTQLSGKHYALTLQEGFYCIRDEGSTNGTYLNGIPLVGTNWVKIASGDKVRAGSYEYRVIIEPENGKK